MPNKTIVADNGQVLTYLDGQFGEKMLAKNTIHEYDWPARSPDINTNFFH